jgi:hypothetical protein
MTTTSTVRGDLPQKGGEHLCFAIFTDGRSRWARLVSTCFTWYT